MVFQLARPGEEWKEVAEGKVTFVDVWKALQVAGKRACQFDVEDSVIIMCNKLEI